MEMFQRRFSILKRKPGGEKRNGLNLPEQKAKILLLIQSDIKDWAFKVAKERPRTTAIYFIGVAKAVGLPMPKWKDIPLQQQKRWNATQILSEEQVLDVIHNHIPKKYIPLCLIACYSLLRRSSVLDLRKKDVDLNEGISVIAGRTFKSDVLFQCTKNSGMLLI